MSKRIPFFLLMFISFKTFTQEISGKILSKNTKSPIENVSIISDLKTGTTTDKNGNFTISINKIKNLHFSFLGFEPKTILVDDLKKMNYTIYLSESTNQLEEIKITSFVFSLDSLLKRTTNSMKKKYYDTIIQQEIYLVKKNKLNFKNLEVDLKTNKTKYSIDAKKMQTELNKLSEYILKKPLKSETDFKGIISSKKINSTYKDKKISFYISDFKEITGHLTYDASQKKSFEELQKEFQMIISKNIHQENTFRVKSGLFKIEDSLSVNEKSFLNDSINFKSFKPSNIASFKTTAEKLATFFNHSDEKNFLNTIYYEHTLEKIRLIDNQKIYEISFKPRKTKSSYQGKLHINSSDFTISKISVSYADKKRGDHINLKLLLGVKFEENLHNLTIYYEKLNEEKIYTSYVKNEKSTYIYANRSFKFIENSNNKNRLKFNFKTEVDYSESFELFFKNPILLAKYSMKPQNKDYYKQRIPFITAEAYSKSTWKNRKEIDEYLSVKK